MTSDLLLNTRKINKTLQSNAGTSVSFEQLSVILSDVLDSNVYIVSLKGKVLGHHLQKPEDSSIIIDEDSNKNVFPVEYTENILKILETRENISGEEALKFFPHEQNRLAKFTTVVPIFGSGERLGTLLLSRYNKAFVDEDLVVAEYAATVVGLEIIRAISEEMEEDMRKKAVVKMAIGTLNELDGNEGLLVASKIADKVGITRSVIVNALRKFESAGVIESRSLGMKGTHIRILNDKLLDELANVR